MKAVRPKKQLGQHFLKELQYCERMVAALQFPEDGRVLEVGPGTGALTQFLPQQKLKVVELDRESVAYLEQYFPHLEGRIYSEDFLRMPLNTVFNGEGFSLVGNFPYNISSQILFHALNFREIIPEIMGMFQKEVAQRIASSPGSKEYGILSVLMQAYYEVTYLFDVPPGAFNPPPKVMSGVIRCSRKPDEITQNIPFSRLKQLVKLAFNQRRKTLRNALASLNCTALLEERKLQGQRAEQLSVQEFIELAQALESTE